jgi:hypothetical protein
MAQKHEKTRKHAKNRDFLTFFDDFCSKNAKKNVQNARICIGRSQKHEKT